MNLIKIENGRLRLGIAPELGAAIAYCDYLRGAQTLPLMRPTARRGTTQPFDLASIVLVPWSNRISGGGFTFEGHRHSLEPNRKGDAFPIHGNGFQSAWDVGDQSSASLTLDLVSDGPGPFAYKAEITYVLDDDALTMTLDVTNRADITLPYGIGFHPWFPRTEGTLLRAPAGEVWLENEEHLPTEKIPVSSVPDWDFRTAKALPQGRINNAFVGWNRQVLIEWPETGLALTLEASQTLPIYILYSPGEESEFFCVEPVSHIVDAHNRPGGPVANGLIPLAPGESASCSCRFAAAEL